MISLNVGLIDIRRYTEGELKLLVFNDEALYALRHRENFREILEVDYVFSEAQWDELSRAVAGEMQG